MMDKALPSQFGGESLNPAEACGEAAESYVSVLPNHMGEPVSGAL